MRIDNKPVESPAITWAECRRERLLLLRLILMSAIELAALALCVLALIAIVAFIQGQRSVAIPAIAISAGLALLIVALEIGYRKTRQSINDLDALTGEVAQEA